MTRATRKRWMIGTVVAVAVGIATAVAVGRYSQAKKKDDKAAVTLEFAPREVVQPAWATMPGSIEFSGPLVAPDTAVVRAKAGGTLVGLAVQEGSHVKAGQSLGRIDLAELQSRSSERQASADAAKAALDQAERTHASNERLAQRGLGGVGAGLALAAAAVQLGQVDAAKRLPSRDVRAFLNRQPHQRAAGLARTTAVSGATSGPENSMLPGIVAHAGCTTSRGANSSVTAALSSFFLAWL